MDKLTADDKNLLQMIEEREELRPLFLSKVKGLKWFDALEERGYFNPKANPKPVPAKDEGYFNIPNWPITDYLVKTAPELRGLENSEYPKKFTRIIVDATNYAKENNFSNYRTWWKFSDVISQIPYQSISEEDIEIVDYWLDDVFERGLVAQTIGDKILPKYLEANDEHALRLTLKIISYLYKVVHHEQKLGDRTRRESVLRFGYHYAQKITERIAGLAGKNLGKDVILLFDAQLKAVVDEQKNDMWSAVWRPAIEDHSQNKHRDDAENVLVHAYRDALSGYIKANPIEARRYIKEMLDSNYQIIHRLAIHKIDRYYHLMQDMIDHLLDAKYLESNYRHEMWHLFNRNYQQLDQMRKQKILSLISGITREDDAGLLHEGATAYNRAIWLAALRDCGIDEEKLYQQNIQIAKTEPEHPDFASYMSVGWGDGGSPIPFEELQSFSIDALVKELNDYKDPGVFREPGVEGLVKAFRKLVKTEPLKFYLHLNKFSLLDLAYVYEIIEAYGELWSEKAQLPWEDIWAKILQFCLDVITQERFWKNESSKERQHFIANRYWIVGGIGRLLQNGTRSDEHAFSEKYLEIAEEIVTYLLDREKGNEFKKDSDAVSVAINSPRGHCLEALINLSLRRCRLEDKRKNKDHSEVWLHFQPYYDAEIDKVDSNDPEYEFVTLVTNYLPNFIYMSKEWVKSNLPRIFDQAHYLKWLCAMQGYAYVGTVYEEIYQYLKEHGDLLKVLDDENIRDKVEEKVIQNIFVAFLNDFESLSDDNSLINILIERNNSDEINHLIWFIWTLRNKEDNKLRNKVYEIWPRIQNNINFETREGRRIASNLCHWAVFVDHVDDERRQLLLTIAPYSDESHNSYELLKCLAEISKLQPQEAHMIWIKLLEGSTPDYPEEALRQIFTGLVSMGPDGIRMAREVENIYLSKAIERPSIWLKEAIIEHRGIL